jgi:glycosyltransferase involved in cell wall biosynthesis
MISIVIPNYNGAVLLKRNLPRLAELLKKSKLEFELIVVDDCSTDDSVLFLRQVKGIRLVEKSKKWNKWLYNSKKDDKLKCAIIAGHYNFNSKEYIKITDQLNKYKKREF